MFPAILTEAQQGALGLLSHLSEVRRFYLAGGTALALHLGHRRSRDFDFFGARDFTPQDLLSALRTTGEVHVLQEARGTLTVRVGDVPTSFFHYDYPLLRPLHDSPWGLKLADPADIAAMKLWAIAGRGSRKDFVDLYAYARAVEGLEEVFRRFRQKYQGITVDAYHLLRSLSYFEDAEAEPMPEMLHAAGWDDIKAFFRAEAIRLFRGHAV
jgi:hypothetical protein